MPTLPDKPRPCPAPVWTWGAAFSVAVGVICCSVLGVMQPAWWWPVATTVIAVAGLTMSLLAICRAARLREELAITLDHYRAAQRSFERKLARSRKKIEEARRTEYKLIGELSHELRTPLSGVLAMTELTLDSSLDAEQRDQLSHVLDQARRLDRHITRTLGLVESTGNAQGPETIRLSESLVEVGRQLEPTVSQVGVRFHWEIASAVPPVVSGEPSVLQHVLIPLSEHLLMSTSRAEVTVRVDAATISSHRGVLRFTITDEPSRLGTPAESSTLDETITGGQPGASALGQAACSRLVERLGGELWFESRTGSESIVFTATFAIPPDAFNGTPKAAADALRILVADDAPINQTVAIKLLERQGHTVTTADNGSEAVDAFRTARHDLILMDLQMPVMDGYAAATAIRRFDRSVPIVAMTAQGQRGDRERCLRAGMDGYVAKPIDRDELYQTIAAVRPANS